MQSPPSLYIPQFQLRELFVCFGRLNRILAEIGHGDFSVHSIMDKPLLLLTLVGPSRPSHVPTRFFTVSQTADLTGPYPVTPMTDGLE